MDPSMLPDKEHVDVTRGVFEWAAYVVTLVGGGWLLKTRADKRVKALVDETKAEVLASVSAKMAPMQAVMTSLDKLPQTVAVLQETVEGLEESRRSFEKAEYVTLPELERMQGACVLHIWDKLLLDLEKRDRARDQQINDKISSICQALAGVKSELQHLNKRSTYGQSD